MMCGVYSGGSGDVFRLLGSVSRTADHDKLCQR